MKIGSLFDGAGTCPYAASLCGVTPAWGQRDRTISPGREFQQLPENAPSRRHLPN